MGIRIADLPDSERPRERLARHGARTLSDAELLALVVRTGGRGANSLDVCRSLLAEWGSLDRIASAGLEDLLRSDDLGVAKAASLLAAFELGQRVANAGPVPDVISGPEDVLRLVTPRLAGLACEEVVLVVTNGANRIIRTTTLTRGSADRCLLVARDVIAAVLRTGGTGFALAHNHPSGDPTPSAEDVAVTRRIDAAARCLGLRFLDHVILGGHGWASALP